jgi:hypothetical protein
MARTSVAKVEFDALLASNETWLNWIEGASQFQSLVSKHIRYESLDKDGKASITARLGVSRPSNAHLLNAFYVTMVAGFEAYLKASLRELVKVQNTAAVNGHNSVPTPILRMNIRETAKLLSRMDSPPDYLNINEADLCLSIGSCAPKSASVFLNEDSFAEISSPLKLETFMSRIEIFSHKMSWEKLARIAAIKAAVATQDGEKAEIVAGRGKAAAAHATAPAVAGVRDTEKYLKDTFADISKFRNRIAHLGGTASDVTALVYKQHLIILRAVSDEFSSLLCA